MKSELKFDELGNVFEMGFDDVTTIHGKDGKDGQDGKDGYTPVKGVDYYTEAEKQELVSAVAEDVKNDVYTKTEIDKQIEGIGQSVAIATSDAYMAKEKAIQNETDITELKASHTWQLIGSAKLSADSSKISIELGTATAKWYGETLMLIEIPKSESINGTTNGNISILGRKNGTTVCRIFVIATTSETYGALNPTWTNRWAVVTHWIDKKPVSTNVSRARASGAAYSLASMSTTNFHSGETIEEATDIVFSASNEFIFPKGSTMKLYGRF